MMFKDNSRLSTPTESVGVGICSLFVCLFVRSITQNDPKVFKLGIGSIGNDLEISTNDVVLGLKGQGHGVNKCIFHTNDYYAYVNAHLNNNSNTAWV